MDNTMKINVETKGFDEAIENIDALVSAYEGFPAQVVIKNCRNCTFNIYPSQTHFVGGDNDE